MRSYYEHLNSMLAAGKEGKPAITRSSALFPAIRSSMMSTRLIFLGYWMLKRKIDELDCRVTIRDDEGKLLCVKELKISEPKAYRIELGEILDEHHYKESTFTGSMEIEFFSDKDLVFPYPAVAINIYGPHFSSVVHTAERVFNDNEDAEANEKQRVPESGFNIYADGDREPFISIINGPTAMDGGSVDLTFINHKNEKKTEEFLLGEINAYETSILYPAREYDLELFFEGRPGTVKVNSSIPGIFPRLLVGNVHNDLPALSITHTYYDCSDAKEKGDFWPVPKDKHYAASIDLPVMLDADKFTKIYFYPICSPASFTVDLEIYNCEGLLLGRCEDVAIIEKGAQKYRSLSIREACDFLGASKESKLAARLIAKPRGENRIPARIKVSFDIGSNPSTLPCNICTNFCPYNPEWENKSSNFRWVPILADHPGATTWIMNATPAVETPTPTSLELTFFREKDCATITRTHTLSPHGFLMIAPDEDSELSDFLDKSIGWVTIKSENPYTSTFYFSENSSTTVGGDHGF